MVRLRSCLQSVIGVWCYLNSPLVSGLCPLNSLCSFNGIVGVKGYEQNRGANIFSSGVRGFDFKEMNIYRHNSTMDLHSSPCPETSSPTFRPGSCCNEIQKLLYKAQKPPRRKLLSLSFLQKLCCVPLITFQQHRFPKTSLWAERVVSFTWLSSYVWRKCWKEATCRALLVMGYVSPSL